MAGRKSEGVKPAARTLAAIYALAILVAGLSPHCGWMFARAEAAAVAAPAHHHAGHAQKAPDKAPARECAAMELAKLVGPVPAIPGVAAPDAVATLPSVPALEPRLAVPVRTIQAARGPPRTAGGFAAAYARNHRLLI